LNVGNQYIALTSQNLNTDPANPTCSFDTQCYIGNNLPFYGAVEQPYNVQDQLNNFKDRAALTGQPNLSAARSSQYGQPAYYQLSRNIRLGVKFTF
jgi:hypothetical protein